MVHSRVWHVYVVNILSCFCHILCHHLNPSLDVRFKLLLTEGEDDGDSETAIRTHAFERGVLALPGTVFLPSGRKTAYARASFSVLEPHQVDEALRRLKEAILDARNAAKK